MILKLLTLLQRWCCHHYDDCRVLEHGRYYLRCPRCGRETVGWQVGTP